MKTRLRRTFAPSLSIRTLIVLWAGSVFLAWAVLVIAWIVAKEESSRFSQRMAADGRALGMARELELALLAERRADLLWRTTGDSQYQQHRDAYRTIAGGVADSLSSYVHTEQGRDLLTDIQGKLEILHDQYGSPAAASLESSTQIADDMLAVANRLYLHARGHMEQTVQAVDRLQMAVSHWMLGLSAGAALVLFIGSRAIIRRVARPALVLTETADAFGRGDFAARAPVAHDDELGALARTFNNMAGDIADRESHRLQFVATVAHDLKNPVLTIEMAGRILRDTSPTEEQRPYVEALVEEASRLKVTLRDLMDDLQVASGHLLIHPTEVELGSLVRQLVQTQARAVTDHELAIETQECTVLGDARRLERVVSNLVSNAVKYSPCNTRIVVRVEKQESEAVLLVSDEGPGIMKEDLQAIFQPFGRGRAADAVAEGTGIGLYVVKQIVDAHKGEIEVHCELGHGTTFLVKLPLAEADRQARELQISGSQQTRL